MKQACALVLSLMVLGFSASAMALPIRLVCRDASNLDSILLRANVIDAKT